MNKKIITDELMAKFLDGKTTEKETNFVLAYLNENDENFKDFFIMQAAIRLKEDFPVNIDFEERLSVIKKQTEQNKQKKNHIAKKIYFIVSSAAAIIILFGITLFITRDISKKNDSLAIENNSNINSPVLPKTDTAKYDDDKSTPTKTNKDENKNYTAKQNTDNSTKTIPTADTLKKPLTVQMQTKKLASKTDVENTFTMIKPNKSDYAILCLNLDQSFTFQWETNAEKILFVLKTKKGNILIQKEETNMTDYSIKLADYFHYEDLQWEITVTFADNKTISEKGIVKLII